MLKSLLKLKCFELLPISIIHNKRHPAYMGNNEVEVFLNHLAVTKKWQRAHKQPSTETSRCACTG